MMDVPTWTVLAALVFDIVVTVVEMGHYRRMWKHEVRMRMLAEREALEEREHAASVVLALIEPESGGSEERPS